MPCPGRRWRRWPPATSACWPPWSPDPASAHERRPLLSAAARHQLLAEWSGGQAAPAAALCLHEIFAARALEAPGAPAVVCGDARGEPSLQGARPAERSPRPLPCRAGVRPEVLVGLGFERSIEIVAASSGCSRREGPTSLSIPPIRRSAWRTSWRAAGARSSYRDAPSSAPRLPAHCPADRAPRSGERRVQPRGERGISSTSPRRTTSPTSSIRRARPAAQGRPGARTATSPGSSRRPRVVRVRPRRRLDALPLLRLRLLGLGDLGRPRSTAGALVIVPYWISRSPDAFHELLATGAGDGPQPDALRLPPARPGRRAEAGARRSGARAALRDLRRRGAGSRRLAPWFDRHGDRQPQLVNMYGITETTVHVTYRPLDRGRSGGGPRRARSAGAIPDLQVYLLDRRARAWCPSASRARSTSAARAWRAATSAGPELTAERFVPDPFGAGRASGSTAPATSPASAGRRPRVPRPHRPPGEDPRLPHRAGRDRGGARAPPGGARGGGPGARGRARRQRAWWPIVAVAPGTAPRPRSSRCATCERDAARLHGAGRLRRPRRAAAHRQRQGRPPRPRRARRASRSALRGPLRAARGRASEELVAAIWQEVLGRRPGRHPRQLLRSRRALAGARPGSAPPPRAARPRNRHGRPLPCLDGRRPGAAAREPTDTGEASRQGDERPATRRELRRRRERRRAEEPLAEVPEEEEVAQEVGNG